MIGKGKMKPYSVRFIGRNHPKIPCGAIITVLKTKGYHRGPAHAFVKYNGQKLWIPTGQIRRLRQVKETVTPLDLAILQEIPL